MKIVSYKGKKPYIFVSYAHKDGDRVLPIVARMIKDGYRVWYDEAVDPGTEWDELIATKLDESSYVIAFLSESFLASDNCKDELNYACDLNKPCLLIYLEDVTLPCGMAMRLDRLQAVFYHRYATEEEFFEKLYQADGIAAFLDEHKEKAPKESAAEKREREYREKKTSMLEVLRGKLSETYASCPAEELDGMMTVMETLLQISEENNRPCFPLSVTKGRRVTRYDIRPASGKYALSSYQKLTDNYCHALNLFSVRVFGAEEGGGPVSIEVPNCSFDKLCLSELMESEAFRESGKTVFCLGEDAAGNPVLPDLKDLPHLLVAGSTGTGKTTFAYAMILSLIAKNTPDELRFVLLDPKKVEFHSFQKLPHLLTPVATDSRKGAAALSALWSTIEERLELFRQNDCRSIDEYNAIASQPMPRIVAIVDEFFDFMIGECRDEVEDSICRILQKGRVAGVHLVLMAQRPTSDTLTATIKANIPSRLCFFLNSVSDSRRVLGQNGAEKLFYMGDALFAPVYGHGTTRVQVAYADDEDLKSMPWYTEARPVYSTDFFNIAVWEEDEKSVRDNRITKEDLAAALEVAVDCGKISTALLQRKNSWGYGRAARVLDYLLKTEYVERTETHLIEPRITRDDIEGILKEFDKL